MSDVQVQLRATNGPDAGPPVTAPGDPVPGTPGTQPPSSPPTSNGPLPFTGGELIAAAVAATVLLVLGGLLVAASRSRDGARRIARRGRLRAGLVAALVIGVAAASTPAWADSHGVDVTVSASSGTRQFSVEDLSGNPLTSLNLGGGGSAPFRVIVKDNDFTGLTSGFQVDAVMNNLYLKSGGAHDFAEKIPSSAVSLSYGATPLSATDVDFLYQPVFNVTGLLTGCSDGGLLGGLGLGDLEELLGGALCDVLGNEGLNVSATVQGVVTQVTAPVSSLLALPTSILGNEPGSFTNPDFTNGIGAGDTAGASGAPAATSLSVMTGTPLSDLPTALVDAISGVLNGLPLVSQDGSGALMSVTQLIAALTASANAAIAELGTLLGQLNLGDATSILESLTATLVPPALSNILSLDGTYRAFPVLNADADAAPAPGDYEGTLTVTFVQE